MAEAIASTGLDMLLDVHGDEEIPANVSLPAWQLPGCKQQKDGNRAASSKRIAGRLMVLRLASQAAASIVTGCYFR